MSMYGRPVCIALLVGSTGALRIGSPSSLGGARCAAARCMAATTAPDLCRALQNGEAPTQLGDFLATSAGVKDLLSAYLTEPEWTCAEEEVPPAALTQSLGSSASSTVDVILMNILNGAAASSSGDASSETQSRRARVLVNALWKGSPMLQDSCRALRDVVADKLGEKAAVGWDQQYEYLKDEWACIIGLMDYDNAALKRILSTLDQCGFEDEEEEEE